MFRKNSTPPSLALGLALSGVALVALCLASFSSDLRVGVARPTNFRLSPVKYAIRKPVYGRAVRVRAETQSPEDFLATIDMASLPYDAATNGLNQAIEDAARVRDTAACRLLEKIRRAQHESELSKGEVPWYRGGSKDRARYDGVMNMSPLEEQRMEIERNRRKQDELKAHEYWRKEDALVEQCKAQGMMDITSKDQYGMPMDVQRILYDAANALGRAITEGEPNKLVSMKLAVDPMPCGFEKVAVIPPPNDDISREPMDRLVIGDVQNADVVYVMNPVLDTEEKIYELAQMAQSTKNGNVIVLDGTFGEPGSMEGKRVRQSAKDLFKGGIQSLQFIMSPVPLTKPVGGDPYPIPDWLVKAGYKATGNLAITGNSGTGKSSLNNAMRGLKPRDDGAAEVGVKETTLEPTPYTIDVAGKQMAMYDLPGAGTPRFPLESYIRNMGIKYFDLADGMRPDQVIDKIREDLEHYTLLSPDRIYMVSSRRPEEFDFQRLKADTQKELTRALDVKLAKALTRPLEIKGVWNSV
ncbi:hypothetical protein AAMO2058_000683200 [Amorphochlora amoebiformis]